MREESSEKTFVDKLLQIRREDNLKSIKTISVLTAFFAFLFGFIFIVREQLGLQSPWLRFYQVSFLGLSLLSFLMRLLYFFLCRAGLNRALNRLIYFYLLAAYFILIGISALDSKENSDFLAYALASFGFSFVFHLTTIPFVLTHLAGLAYFILFYYLVHGKIVSFLFLLPLFAFLVFAFYIAYSREKTQVKMLQMAEELEKTHQEVKEVSLRDPLTGLYNRRYSDDFVSFQFEGFLRKGTPFSIILFDIDHFKAVNDDFGHSAGDAVLVRISEVITLSIRKTDLAVRYGGEEFLLILSDTHLASAEIIAERLRRSIESIKFAELDRQVTVSLGVTEIKSSDSKEALIERADKALYKAKGEGRNRIVLSD
jgi:diguanylate cyclase (GGDEF)-like protein